MPKFASAYKDKIRVQTENKEPSRTKQNLKDSADVNKIIKRYGMAHIQQQAALVELEYGEITSMDLKEAHMMLEKSKTAFMEVPSTIRAQFNNDPGAWIDYATNPDNLEQMREWGLANPAPPEIDDSPLEVVITNPEPPA